MTHIGESWASETRTLGALLIEPGREKAYEAVVRSLLSEMKWESRAACASMACHQWLAPSLFPYSAFLSRSASAQEQVGADNPRTIAAKGSAA